MIRTARRMDVGFCIYTTLNDHDDQIYVFIALREYLSYKRFRHVFLRTTLNSSVAAELN